MPQIMATAQELAQVTTVWCSMGIWVNFQLLYNLIQGSLKRPPNLSGTESVHQHHAHSSAPHIAGIPRGREYKKENTINLLLSLRALFRWWCNNQCSASYW